MTRTKIIWFLVILALIAGAIGAYSLLPKRYTIGESLAQTYVFWNDREAFFFLNTSTTGQSANFLHDKLRATHYAYLAFFLGGGPRFFEQNLRAYRLLPSGELKSVPLPPESAAYGNWTLVDGKLQLTPPPATGYKDRNGFRWDGEKFVAVPFEQKPQAKSAANSRLSPDDEADEDDAQTGFLTDAARNAFKEAHWHYKQLTGFSSNGTQATLPIDMSKASFELTITSFPRPTGGITHFDMLTFGTKSMGISKRGNTESKQVLWTQNGWQPISKGEFERRSMRSGQGVNAPFAVWGWLVLFLFLTVWRFGSWGHLLLGLFSMKRRVVNNMATSYTFPPATAAQFPLLDTAALERYSQEFESMGFVRLLDFSLVSNRANPIPTFCRLFAHTRHHCFGEVSQLFPRGKSPMPLKCSIQSVLENGWSLGFSDRKPQAASAMIRRRKALGVSMPGATAWELLQAFLQMRDQVCQDLGISPMRDDSLEAYIAKTQAAASDMRDVVQQKNFVTAVSNYYYRKFSLLKTREEYTWLGDYPKEAERRKQGYATEARAL
ncbi:MAG TPA: hypothetical protein VJO16_06120 [Candidatus Acidoferrum sp.]|nr:hypothetical protein [Candidatus Acidoferrum sp.]